MKFNLSLIIVLITVISFKVNAKDNYYNQAKELFEKKAYDESKFLFQRNIVFNPKDAKSYLYLAKIYEIEENKIEVEKNLDTSLLLEPNNEEAMYMLIDIELKNSNFSKVKKLNEKFKKICVSLCPKITSINKRLENFQEKDDS